MLLDITLPQREKSYEVDKSYSTMRHVNRKSTHTHVKICTKKKVKGSSIVNHFVSFLMYFNFCKVYNSRKQHTHSTHQAWSDVALLLWLMSVLHLRNAGYDFVPSFYLFIQAWIHIHMMCLCNLTYQRELVELRGKLGMEWVSSFHIYRDSGVQS